MAGALATMKQTFICSDYDILKFQQKLLIFWYKFRWLINHIQY
jgi:hypothetical protein